MIAEDGVDDMADGDRQGQDGDVPSPEAPPARRFASGRGRHARHSAKAAITSADCTTSACRGKMRPVRKL